MRSTEAMKTASTRPANVSPSRPSWAKACTVRISCSVSSTCAVTSATRSCTVRESLRTLSPSNPIGSSTKGMHARARSVSFTLVKKSITTQPTIVIAMRNA